MIHLHYFIARGPRSATLRVTPDPSKPLGAGVLFW